MGPNLPGVFEFQQMLTEGEKHRESLSFIRIRWNTKCNHKGKARLKSEESDLPCSELKFEVTKRRFGMSDMPRSSFAVKVNQSAKTFKHGQNKLHA